MLKKYFLWLNIYIFFFLQDYLMNISKEHNIFEIYCIINVFTLTLDQFIVSSLNKSISLFSEKCNLTDLKLLNMFCILS